MTMATLAEELLDHALATTHSTNCTTDQLPLRKLATPHLHPHSRSATLLLLLQAMRHPEVSRRRTSSPNVRGPWLGWFGVHQIVAQKDPNPLVTLPRSATLSSSSSSSMCYARPGGGALGRTPSTASPVGQLENTGIISEDLFVRFFFSALPKSSDMCVARPVHEQLPLKCTLCGGASPEDARFDLKGASVMGPQAPTASSHVHPPSPRDHTPRENSFFL